MRLSTGDNCTVIWKAFLVISCLSERKRTYREARLRLMKKRPEREERDDKDRTTIRRRASDEVAGLFWLAATTAMQKQVASTKLLMPRVFIFPCQRPSRSAVLCGFQFFPRFLDSLPSRNVALSRLNFSDPSSPPGDK